MDNCTTTKIKGVYLPKTQQGWDKFNKLTEAAERLFTESSFFEVSVSDICRAAGTAVGTFYIYFDTKTDVYRYLVEAYGKRIRSNISKAIAHCKTRECRERAGIKSFVKLSVESPMLYNIIWGSLAVDKELFENYYISFARSYARALSCDRDELKDFNITTLSYALMGISSFLGLRAIFENMSEDEIDEMIDETFMPMIKEGLIKGDA